MDGGRSQVEMKLVIRKLKSPGDEKELQGTSGQGDTQM